MNLWKFAFSIAIVSFLCGCQTAAEAPATPSGRPEVTIKSSAAAIKARLLSLALDRKFNVTKDTEYLLQVEKPSDNIAAAVLFGSKFDAVPAERIVFTFAPVGDSVRVVATSVIVTNPGSGFEQITPIDSGPAIQNTQTALEQIKRDLEAAPAPTPAQPKSSVHTSKPKPAS